jgi:Ca2+-binding EF-hand superfamily protein
MCATEFKKVLVDLGKRDITDAQVQKMLQDVDKNGDSVICWNEFLEVSVKKVFKDIDV